MLKMHGHFREVKLNDRLLRLATFRSRGPLIPLKIGGLPLLCPGSSVPIAVDESLGRLARHGEPEDRVEAQVRQQDEEDEVLFGLQQVHEGGRGRVVLHLI